MVPSNLVRGSDPRDFCLWVDPRAFLVQANVTATGQFSSAELIDEQETLPFVRNPKYGGLVTPFVQSVTQPYGAEYNLEIIRRQEYQDYPSRLCAVFLFADEPTANRYATRHSQHVGGRVLQSVKTVGPYSYSVHDSSWVDYMRIPHFWRPQRMEQVSRDYWRGRAVDEYTLSSFGELWTRERLDEILYSGTVEFYDQSWVEKPTVGLAKVLLHEPSKVFREFLERRPRDMGQS